MKKNFYGIIGALNERMQNLEIESRETCQEIIKDFMEKYQTNQIEFDLESDDFPTFILSRIDEDNADCDIRKIVFDENGKMISADGYLYYEDGDIYDEPFDNFYDVDYLDLAELINEQLENGRYTED